MTLFLCVFHVIVATPALVPPAHDSEPLPVVTTLPPVSFASEALQPLSVPVNVYFMVAGDGARPGLILATPSSQHPTPCGPEAEDGMAIAADPRARAATAPAMSVRRMPE